MKSSVQLSPIEALMSASPVVQLTLLILISMSIFCWAIVIAKRKQLQGLEKANDEFLDQFWKASSLDEVYKRVERFSGSNIARIFSSGFIELQKIADSKNRQNPNSNSIFPQLRGIDNFIRALKKSVDSELAKVENRLSFLATTGSTGPFIGLFGTVWGIMNAFHKIGQTGAASLAVVAPGISEALIATAIGLAAAIPAVVCYNHFLNRIKKQELEMEAFCTDFTNLVKRDFFQKED